MARRKTTTKQPERRHFVFSEEVLNGILERSNQGFQMLRHENPWFKNIPGVRKPGLKWEWTPEELRERYRCMKDINYFAEKYCKIKTEDGSINNIRLRDYQKDILDLYKSNRCILMASRQTGKDQPLNSKLWTDNGPIKMGDVKLGDKIFDESGKLTNVVGIYPQGKKDVYEITFADGSKVKTGYEHLWGVQTANGTYSVRTLKDIINSGYLTPRGDYKYFVQTTKPVEYSKKDLEMDPYLLGLLLGDGSISQSSIIMATIEPEIVNYLKDTIEDDNMKIKQVSNCSYRISSSKGNTYNVVNEQLKKLKLKGTNSSTKFIPTEYLYSSLNDRLALLQGLMDTDGSISSKGIIEYSTVSKQLADNVQELCESLGIVIRRTIKKSHYTYKGEYKTGKLVYRLKLQLPNDYEYSIFKLERKQNLVKNKKFDWGYRRGIAKIELIGQEETQCIEVDNETHLYLTDHYIPTHNTISAAITILHYITFNNDKGVMIVANKANTVIEIIDKIKNIYKELPFFLKTGVINWSNRSLAFENGCRIKSEARTKEPSIGFTIDFLYLDEFAHIPSSIINHYYRSVVPTVSSITNSKIIITSTPNGYNLFHELWEGANREKGDPKKNPYMPLKVYWHQVPGRLNTKLYFNDLELGRKKLNKLDILAYMRSLGMTIEEKMEVTDKGELNTYYAIIYTPEFNIDYIRALRYENTPFGEFSIITNWEEQETMLIGSKENFDQEYNLHFLTGSKRLFEPSVMNYIHGNRAEYEHVQFDILDNDLGFGYSELKWIKDRPDIFNVANMKKYYYKVSLDIGEGLGQDSSVINIFKLCKRSNEEIEKLKPKDMYDMFQYVQVGKYSYNMVSIPEFARLFYYLIFEILDPERVKVVLEINTYGGEFLAKLPQVNDGNNNYGSYVFLRYKHRIDATERKIGLKLTKNKNIIVKNFQTCVNSNSIIINEPNTIKQLDTFVKHDTKAGNVVYKAETGHDDDIMTCINGSTVLEMTEYKNMCDMVYNDLDRSDIDVIIHKLNENVEDIYSAANLLKGIKGKTFVKTKNTYTGRFIRK